MIDKLFFLSHLSQNSKRDGKTASFTVLYSSVSHLRVIVFIQEWPDHIIDQLILTICNIDGKSSYKADKPDEQNSAEHFGQNLQKLFHHTHLHINMHPSHRTQEESGQAVLHSEQLTYTY